MDGIDAALVDVDTNTLIAGITRPYSDAAKQSLENVLKKDHSSPAVISQLNTLLGREFAAAVQQLLIVADTPTQDVIAIGSHGQTICHDAMAEIPYTVQLGCAHTIAELTGITVVADFRTRDVVVGGQGAPFAPIYHQALFGKRELPLAVVNIGGIANVSYLTKDAGVSGYDVGPGNCLMDSWIQQHLGLAYDQSGAWAATGEVIPALLTNLLSDPCFNLPPPKSLGKEYFSSMWLAKCLRPEDAPNDVQATLLELTAITIANEIKKSDLTFKGLALCGGGAHNTALQNALMRLLPDVQIESTKVRGFDPDFIEAMMFAWLADKTVNQVPLDLRQITGAKTPAILGAVYAAGGNFA
jgi:anhydro-N-acetylmuramic acid kinase